MATAVQKATAKQGRELLGLVARKRVANQQGLAQFRHPAPERLAQVLPHVLRAGEEQSNSNFAHLANDAGGENSGALVRALLR